MIQNGSPTQNGSAKSLGALRTFARERPPVERCDLCGVDLAPDHQHLFAPANRQLACACAACAILFGGAAQQKYRLVPRRVRHFVNFHQADSDWDALLIPVGMAFFFHSSVAGRVMAYYPSPAGATESLLDFETWAELERDNPVLGEMEPDVEALLVNRLQGARDYYIAPIDTCYELVGLIRVHWRGLSGGEVVWNEIGKFFTKLQEAAQPVGAAGELRLEQESRDETGGEDNRA